MAGEALLPVFSLQPDWSRDMLQRFTWRTDVLDAQDGSEQLRGTRTTPRVMLEFAWLAINDDRRYLENLAYAHGAGRWLLPVWMDGVALAAPLASGATSVPVDTTWRGFDATFAAIIGPTAQDVEVLTVSAVAPGALTVAATTRTWAPGSVVVPLRIARMDTHAAEMFTGCVSSGTARFTYAQANPGTAVAPLTMYRGLPVMEYQPTWIREPQHSLDRQIAVHDDDIGIPYVVDTAGMPLGTQTHDFRLFGRASIGAFLQFAYWLDGKRGAFWLPTWNADLRVTASIASAATTLTVAATGYCAHVNLALNRRDIRITLTNGAVYHRRIIACVTGSGTETLTIDSPLGVTVAVADIAQVCFLQVARSDADVLELAWWTGCQADASMLFRALRRDV